MGAQAGLKWGDPFKSRKTCWAMARKNWTFWSSCTLGWRPLRTVHTAEKASGRSVLGHRPGRGELVVTWVQRGRG